MKNQYIIKNITIVTVLPKSWVISTSGDISTSGKKHNLKNNIETDTEVDIKVDMEPNIEVDMEAAMETVVLKNHHIAVSEGRFQYIGDDLEAAITSLKDNTSNNPDINIYDGGNKILMPPFVNSHTHLPMTLMRNRADDKRLHDWLFQSIFPVEDKLRAVDVRAGTNLSLAEMILSGTGICANMYMQYKDAFDGDLAGEAGLKLYTALDLIKKDSNDGRIMDTKEFGYYFSRYQDSYDGRIKTCMLVHSIYLYEEKIYYNLADFAQTHNLSIHTHLSETKKEVEDCLDLYKMTPAAAMEKFGLLDVPVLAAHCVHLTDEDIGILKKKNISVAHNPVSNLKLGSGFADIRKLKEAGINVCIGTDGAASNNCLDMVQDMRIAAYISKGLYNDPLAMDAKTIFQMATCNGASALGFSRSGQIREGYDADFIIIDTDSVNMSPKGDDPVSAIVYSMKSSDIRDLAINGKYLMKNRELLTIDLEQTLYDAQISTDYLYNPTH